MKRAIMLLFGVALTTMVDAQPIVSILTEGITKVIRAVDLEVQREQTKTVLLQGAQQELQNAMSALRLGEIQDWMEQFKELYANYFQELWQVKGVVSGYHRVNEMIQRQEQIVSGCQKGRTLFGQDKHFSPGEVTQMVRVYSGILTASLKNLEQLSKAIQPGTFQMTDQERVSMIDAAAREMDRNYRDMQVYTNENELIALQRANDEHDYITLKNLYGL